MPRKRRTSKRSPEESVERFIQTTFNCHVIKLADGFAVVTNYYNGLKPSVIKGSSMEELLSELVKHDNY